MADDMKAELDDLIEDRLVQLAYALAVHGLRTDARRIRGRPGLHVTDPTPPFHEDTITAALDDEDRWLTLWSWGRPVGPPGEDPARTAYRIAGAMRAVDQ